MPSNTATCPTPSDSSDTAARAALLERCIPTDYYQVHQDRGECGFTLLSPDARRIAIGFRGENGNRGAVNYHVVELWSQAQHLLVVRLHTGHWSHMCSLERPAIVVLSPS